MSFDSPFTDRLRTNYIPSPEEEPGIRNIIQQHCATVRELDSKLAAIDKTIPDPEARRREIVQRRDDHHTFADAHKALLSCVLRLSPDILSEIFMDLAPDSGEWDIQPRTLPHPIVWVSHGCQQFRAIALSRPMLWTTIFISELPVPHDPSPTALQATERRMGRVTDMASTFIRRAGKCSMAIHLGARDHEFPSDLPEYTTTIEPFASALRQARWKVLDFNLQCHRPSSPFLQILELSRRSSTLVGARFLLHADSFDNTLGAWPNISA